ncbi:hypothetical protein [Priestia megaterium]|uniref:hypothetical protein n=1 Tax=Priestia megaterium TaxID=1404 RepID=UPI0032D96E96
MKELEKHSYFTEEFLKERDSDVIEIEKFRKMIASFKIIDPLKYLLDFRFKIGVTYEKYLYVKAHYSKLKRNPKALETIQEYWEVWVKE